MGELDNAIKNLVAEVIAETDEDDFSGEHGFEAYWAGYCDAVAEDAGEEEADAALEFAGKAKNPAVAAKLKKVDLAIKALKRNYFNKLVNTTHKTLGNKLHDQGHARGTGAKQTFAAVRNTKKAMGPKHKAMKAKYKADLAKLMQLKQSLKKQL